MIVGLAGHIDHGKTALVKALTGVAGDRLKDEKARGITIDLGFAYMPTRSGQPIGFIDVPGHERFVHTMLAGASGVDFALLTIAVDDGIMPQTLEHLAILDLLGVDRGVVVLTKADLASSDAIERVARAGESDDRDDNACACGGPDRLGADRRGRGRAARPSRRGGWRACAIGQRGKRFRLAVDRVFTLSGVGVVATGTVLSGSVHLGDRIQLSPSGLFARVRSLHAQNRPAEAAHEGERCALNLTGPDITKDAIRRGDVALDPELHAPTDRIDARIRRPPSRDKAGRTMVPCPASSCGDGSWRAHRPVRRQADRSGEEADVQLVLERPIAAAAHDRFVVRDVSAQRTLGRRPVSRFAWEGQRKADAGEARAARRARADRSVRLPSRRSWKRRRSPLTLPRSREIGRSPPS